LCMDDVRF
jgi:hypothetical protein